ncbi:hypothetical protein [Winogradskyella immobilis]|uniref:Lipoprotein n=1 Tax=Winogradskyella immobilis TaxID=2816852 RepID=A0ABS8EMY4_9FLAO|nr:hypothetical protein [Winogradskyella immobilis]MCC1483935.1 hypothetical protein [Winogradskyella immobilis]MCG0016028.1 hypothetical protein [Winogradskyella immobilis]
MGKISRLKYVFINLILITILTNCSTSKINGRKLISKNVSFDFANCCLATLINGNGKIDVYEKKLKITIEKGSIKINPKFDNPTYTIGEIFLSLGRYTDKEEKNWRIYNHSKPINIDKKINSLRDSIDISKLKFEIPYYSKYIDLRNSWIVITTTNKERNGLNHSHSINKIQKYN